MRVLTDAQWDVLRPLVEAVHPRGKAPHRDLRQTFEAILWRHQNGAKWRSIPAELGPWERAGLDHLSVSTEGMKRPAWTASGKDRSCKLGGPTLPVRG
ncbi:MAG: transposase [Acetobacteraceae bacterium]|nr:transposase [Acetobacteraceae bacterium]